MSLDDALRRGALQRIPADEAAAGRLLADAQLHLSTAEGALANGDLAGAYQLGYDAARKALISLLLARGYRLRSREGAHATLIQVTRELLGDDAGMEGLPRLERLRRTRNRAEYHGYFFTRGEVEDDLRIARSVVEGAVRIGGDG